MAHKRDDALPEGFEFEGYRIDRVLGAGGFGITYLATDIEFGRTVALKEYLPSGIAGRVDGTTVRPLGPSMRADFDWGLASFREEGLTLAAFHHQNIVPVFRFFEAHRTAYLAMRYVEGEPLDAMLERRAPDEVMLRAILDPLLDGLEQVHEAGFLHRDIKPANIVLGKRGEPVLIDFGAARQALGDRSMSQTAIVSAGYSPPEQYGSRGRRGPATDIYALSATLYRCVTGRRPPDAPDRLLGDTPLVPAAKAAAGRFSRELLNAIDAGLTLDADKRPQSVEAFRVLARARDEAGRDETGRHGARGAAPGPSRPPRPGPKPKPKARPGRGSGRGSGGGSALLGRARQVLSFLAPVAGGAAIGLAGLTAFFTFEDDLGRLLSRIGLSLDKYSPGSTFRDCPDCPEMVVVPSGEYRWGYVAGEDGRPGSTVRIGERLALGRYEVTFEQWAACVDDGGCGGHSPSDDRGWGRGERPVVNVSWHDARAYTEWLSRVTGHRYRLPTDAEWEYAARAGTETLWYWGDELGEGNANCQNCGSFYDGEATAPVGAFDPNPFGLHDMAGNVWEWTQDCVMPGDTTPPPAGDGSARTDGDCDRRHVRGGAWNSEADYTRSSRPVVTDAATREVILGFRVVREIAE